MKKYLVAAGGFSALSDQVVLAGLFSRKGESLFSKIGPASISNSEGEETPQAETWVLVCEELSTDQKQHLNIVSEEEFH